MRIFKLSAIAAALLAASSAYAVTITPLNWTSFLQGNASASISTFGNISLFAQGVSWSNVSANLGSLGAGTITESFNYETRSVAWWENTGASYLSGSSPIYNTTYQGLGDSSYVTNATYLNGIQNASYASRSGFISETFFVDGDTELFFNIFPNLFSVNGDHLGTYFDITNLSIEYTPAAPVPEPETYALMLAGLGAVGFMVRRRKKSI